MADTCDGECSPNGRCDPRHPLHCCHLVATESVQVSRKMVRFHYACVKCGKTSTTKVTILVGPEPRLKGPAI